MRNKYIYSDGHADIMSDLFVEGYYTGLMFVNQIGISEQVPAVIEITTNKTSSKKRTIRIGNREAIIRKSKITITFQNYKILQFLDLFNFISMSEVEENAELLKRYIKDNNFTKEQFSKYISLYGTSTIKKIVEGGIINAFI